MDLNIKLTPQLAKVVQQKVDSGLYGSASEVVHAALRLLAESDHAQDAKLEQLRRDIQDGLASGPAVPWDPDKVKQLGRSKRGVKASGK